MATEKIKDPVLGDGAILFGSGAGAWGTFEREFAPTKSRVLILASIVEGGVPQAERDLYREIESWYPKGVQEVFQAVRDEVEKDEVLRKWLPRDQIPTRLKLMKLDLRMPIGLARRFGLRYRFDPDKPDWIVTITENYQVDWCGLAD